MDSRNDAFTEEKELGIEQSVAENNADAEQSEPQESKGKTFWKKVWRGIKFLANRWFIVAFSGMATGLFCTLIAGTILQTIARIFGDTVVAEFITGISSFAKVMMGAGIGVGIAHSLKAPRMVVAVSVAAGFIGAYASVIMDWAALSGMIAKGSPGDPINSFLCALTATELGKLVCGKTKLDIIVVPLTGLLSAGLMAISLGIPVGRLTTAIGVGINHAATVQPFLMSIIISVSMGLLLTLPTSSAAIGVAAGLNGLAAGAAVAGCCAHMIGFAVASFRENKWSGLISQGLGTSMLQIPNLGKNPRILIPAIVASLVCGPVAVCLFGLQSTAVGSGMGTAGLVGVIETVTASLEIMPLWQLITGVALCCFVLPAAIALGVSELMRKFGWIKSGDMKLAD